MDQRIYSPTRYAKVTFLPAEGKRRRTVLVRILRDTPRYLQGLVVDREGSPIERRVKGGYAHELIVAGQDEIERVPMRLNLYYGELEPVDDPDFPA